MAMCFHCTCCPQVRQALLGLLLCPMAYTTPSLHPPQHFKFVHYARALTRVEVFDGIRENNRNSFKTYQVICDVGPLEVPQTGLPPPPPPALTPWMMSSMAYAIVPYRQHKSRNSCTPTSLSLTSARLNLTEQVEYIILCSTQPFRLSSFFIEISRSISQTTPDLAPPDLHPRNVSPKWNVLNFIEKEIFTMRTPSSSATTRKTQDLTSLVAQDTVLDSSSRTGRVLQDRPTGGNYFPTE